MRILEAEEGQNRSELVRAGFLIHRHGQSCRQFAAVLRPLSPEDETDGGGSNSGREHGA